MRNSTADWPTPIYRKKVRRGKVGARMIRLIRNEELRPTKVVGVIDRNGVLLDPDSYKLGRGRDASNNVVYLREPMLTTGVTVLFEAESLKPKHIRLAWQRRVARSLREQGFTFMEISHRLGVHVGQVRFYCG